jgi:predicted nucleotide-binding protein (sugar kinase/HSP70/actin superfamily)
MKVKIKKKSETKEFEAINDWSDVTLDKWLKLVDINKDSSSEEALKTLKHLTNIPEDLIKQLSIADVSVIMEHFTKLQEKANTELTNIIEVEGKEYGFHPKLDDITLGEYADIETMIVNGLEKNLPELMAVLYRPITEKKNGKYTIEAYDGDIAMRSEEMRKMSAQEVQNAMVFFWTFATDLLRILPSFLMERVKKSLAEIK